MKIAIDFNKFKSLGNVYASLPVDNLKKFEDAELFYNSNSFELNKAIVGLVDRQPGLHTSPSEIIISTSNYPNHGFIKSLTLKVESLDDKNYSFTLTDVQY